MTALAILLDLSLLHADRPLAPLETAPAPAARQTEQRGSPNGSVIYVASFAGTLGLLFLLGCALLIRAHHRAQRAALDQQVARQADGWAGLSVVGARGATRPADEWRVVAGHGKLPIPKLFEARIDRVCSGEMLESSEPVWIEEKMPLSLTLPKINVGSYANVDSDNLSLCRPALGTPASSQRRLLPPFVRRSSTAEMSLTDDADAVVSQRRLSALEARLDSIVTAGDPVGVGALVLLPCPRAEPLAERPLVEERGRTVRQDQQAGDEDLPLLAIGFEDVRLARA